MAYERVARKRGGGWIIAIPAEVRRWLRITNRAAVFWHLGREREAIITTSGQRKAGRPEVTRITRELAAARNEIDAIRRRDEYRDRGLYAEGYTHGYIQAQEQLMHPTGPSAERSRRLRLRRAAFPDATYLTDPKQVAPRPGPSRPRMNARTRRAKRDAVAPARAVEAHSIDHYPEPSPSPEVAGSTGEAVAPGAEPTGHP